MKTLEKPQVQQQLKTLDRTASYEFMRNFNDVMNFCEFSFKYYDGPIPDESQTEIDTYCKTNNKNPEDLKISAPGSFHKVCSEVREARLAQLKDPVVFDLIDGVAHIVSIWDERGRLESLSDLLLG